MDYKQWLRLKKQFFLFALMRAKTEILHFQTHILKFLPRYSKAWGVVTNLEQGHKWAVTVFWALSILETLNYFFSNHSPQCLHFIAFAFMSSAQKGQVCNPEAPDSRCSMFS